MNHQLVLGAALAAVLASGIITPAYAAGGKEKCYGVAAAGQNDCSNLSNTHSCAGMAKTNNSLVEWKLVAKWNVYFFRWFVRKTSQGQICG